MCFSPTHLPVSACMYTSKHKQHYHMYPSLSVYVSFHLTSFFSSHLPVCEPICLRVCSGSFSSNSSPAVLPLSLRADSCTGLQSSVIESRRSSEPTPPHPRRSALFICCWDGFGSQPSRPANLLSCICTITLQIWANYLRKLRNKIWVFPYGLFCERADVCSWVVRVVYTAALAGQVFIQISAFLHTHKKGDLWFLFYALYWCYSAPLPAFFGSAIQAREYFKAGCCKLWSVVYEWPKAAQKGGLVFVGSWQKLRKRFLVVAGKAGIFF